MPKCIVKNCPYWTGSKKKDPMIVLHGFPKEFPQIKQWLLQTNQDFGDIDQFAQKVLDGKKTDSFRMCSTHFTSDSYCFQGCKIRLKKNAIPTVFPKAESSTEDTSETGPPFKKFRPNSFEDQTTILTGTPFIPITLDASTQTESRMKHGKVRIIWNEMRNFGCQTDLKRSTRNIGIQTGNFDEDEMFDENEENISISPLACKLYNTTHASDGETTGLSDKSDLDEEYMSTASELEEAETTNEQLDEVTIRERNFLVFQSCLDQFYKNKPAMDGTELDKLEFFSWEELTIFVETYCEQTKCPFVRRSFIPINQSTSNGIDFHPEVVEALKYSHAHFLCKKSYRKWPSRAPKKKPVASDGDKANIPKPCEAFITFKLSEQRNSLVVAKYQLNHNHKLCPKKFALFFKRGFLMANSCLPIRTTNTISKKFVGARDIKDLLRSCYTKKHGIMDTLSVLDNLFTSDPEAKVKLVFLEDQIIINTVFIVTSFMASVFQRFPGILIFDRIVGFNEEFDLYSFVCIDDNLQGRDCAYVLVRKGTYNLLRFALASLVQSVPEVKFKVHCVILGIDIEQKKIIQEILPTAHTHMLSFQVLQKLYSWACEKGAAEGKKIWSLLCDAAYSTSSEDYNEAVTNLHCHFPKDFMKYFMEEWHACREMWTDMKSTDHLNLDPAWVLFQHKQKLTAALRDNATVSECIQDLLVFQNTSKDIQKEDEFPFFFCPSAVFLTELDTMEFFSWEEFTAFFDAYCEQKNAVFFLKSSTLLNRSDWKKKPIEPEIVETLKYSWARFECKHFKISIKKEQRELTEDSVSDEEENDEIIGCGAFITLKLCEERNSLVVTEWQLNHNHVLCPKEFEFYYKRGYLLATPCLPVHTINRISKNLVKAQDIKQLLCSNKIKDHDIMATLSALDDLFISDPKSKVKLMFVENPLTIKMLFFLNSSMASLCQRFPTMLVFDKIVRFNEEFDLFSFVCIDDNEQAKDCAYVIARKGTRNLLRFSLASLVQSMPEVKFKVRCVKLGFDVEKTFVVQEMLPSARAKMPSLQILKTLYSKVCAMGAKEPKTVWCSFYDAASATSPEDYNEAVKKLDELCPKDFMKYFMDEWHPCWEMWRFDSSQLDPSMILVEQKKKATAGLRKNTTVAECIQSVMGIQTTTTKVAKVTIKTEEVVEEEEPFQSAPTMDEPDLYMMEFFSWEKFTTFFDDYCEQRKALFFMRNSALLSQSRRNRLIIDPDVVENLKYSCVRFNCKNYKASGKPEQGSLQEENASDGKNTKKFKGCGAYITLRLSDKRNSLVVTECQLSHNHELCPTEFAFFFRKGFLMANACLPVRTTNKISKKFVGPLDIKELLSSCNTKGYGIIETLTALDNLFTADPEAKVKLVFLEDQIIISTVFIVTSFMASLFQHFPGILIFDRFLSFNEEFDLYSFVCIDDNFQGRDCAYVLARKGTGNLLRFALASLVQSVPEVKFLVQCVIVGLDIEERSVIKEMLPCARTQMLTFQVLQKLYDKVCEMGAEEDQNIWSLLCDAASSTSPEDYSEAVKNMELHCSKDFMEYFMDEWHSCWDMWVDMSISDTSHLDPAVVLSQYKHKLTTAIRDNATVAECIQDLMVIQTISKNIKQEDEVPVVCRPPVAMEGRELYMMEFFSWEEFTTCFDAYCEEKKAVFFLKNYILLSRSKWNRNHIPAEVMEALKYSYAHLACKKLKIPNRREVGSLKQMGKNEACGAYIILNLSEKRNSLVVTECLLFHNHELCPDEFALNFKKGFLMANACLPLRKTNRISKTFVGAQDIKRLLGSCNTKDHGIRDLLMTLDNLFINDPEAKVKLVFIEDQVIVNMIFIVTPPMAAICHRFPVVLIFDRIVSFNEEFDLYSFMCIDDNFQGRDCAYVLARKEAPNLLHFAVTSLVQSVPEVQFLVQCVMLGLDIEMKGVVQEFLPSAQTQMFRLQVLQKLYDKALEMGAEEDKKLWSLLCDVASSTSEDDYNQAVKNMELYFSKDFMNYFMEKWHSCHEMWVDMFRFNSLHQDPVLVLSQCKQKLTAVLRNNATLAECIHDLMATQTTKEEIKKENDVAALYKTVCNTESASVIEEELDFSTQCVYDIKDNSDGFSLSDGVSEYIMDRDLFTCSCIMHKSSFLPCRHLFATRLQNGKALFDLKLLEKNKDSFTKMF